MSGQQATETLGNALPEMSSLPEFSDLIETPPARQDRAGTGDEDPFLAHYFRRIPPQVAASFTDEQRRAIKTMFDGRSIKRHRVDVRRSLGFGRMRVYLVLLMGREQRFLPLSAKTRRAAGLTAYGGRFAIAFGLLAALFGLVYLLKG